AVSEITALSSTTFLVDERDGNFPAGTGFKQLWKIDLTGATDVGPSETVPGAVYDGSAGGLLVGRSAIGETVVSSADAAGAAATLAAEGITPVAETQYLDIDALLGSLDPQFRFFSHDKVEGVAVLPNGLLAIANDSDFGISGVSNTAAPWRLQAKI